MPRATQPAANWTPTRALVRGLRHSCRHVAFGSGRMSLGLVTIFYKPESTIRTFNEQRWAVAQVQLGIFIQSWDLSGGSFNSEPPTWVLAWNRSELNPSGSRNYQDNAFAGDYIQYAPATSSRQYAIWAVCRVTAIAQAGFAVDTRASASVSCKMPFLLVGQIPN